MALISKKDFALKCGLTTKNGKGVFVADTGNLSVYIKRGKVTVDKENPDYIDDELDSNHAFIELMRAKKGISGKSKKASPLKSSPAKNSASSSSTGDEEELEEIDFNKPLNELSVTESTRMQKALQVQKAKLENERLEIELAKKKGEVIPTPLIQPVFYQHNQHMMVGFKNAGEKIITQFGKLKSLSNDETVEMRKLFHEGINNAIADAAGLTANSIESIIQQLIDDKK